MKQARSRKTYHVVAYRRDPKGRTHGPVDWAEGLREPLVQGTVRQDEWSGAPLRTVTAVSAAVLSIVVSLCFLWLQLPRGNCGPEPLNGKSQSTQFIRF